jgi:thioredoxin reductase (NADPH)
MSETELRAIAFPTLTADQLGGLGHCSLCKLRHFHDGEALFRAGDRDPRFFVVTAGRIEIVDETGDSPKSIAVHDPGAFAGDVSLITGRPAIVSGYARGDTNVIEVTPGALKQLINHDPEIGDLILRAFMARRQLLRDSTEFTGLRVIGTHSSQDAFRIRDFLQRNVQPYTWIDIDTDRTAKDLLSLFGVTEADTPVVSCARKMILKNPPTRQLAEALGLRKVDPKHTYDLAVVGAGPAGLAAGVYGASEGLSTIVLEMIAPGGQAGRSMRIENYLGFPTGIQGNDLTERAIIQATKFGACLPVGAQACGLAFDGPMCVVRLDGGDSVTAKCVIVATGAEYRVLGVPGCERYEGRGVYYAATPLEVPICRGNDVVVIGGGNSAGQAAVFLSHEARKVYVVIRGDDLGKSMSDYLVRRIEGSDKIDVLKNTTIKQLDGDGELEQVELTDHQTGEVKRLKSPAVFSFIGANPRTDWLPPEIERDAKGFVSTGPSLAKSPHWTLKRPPFFLETSRPGVFAAGDVRGGSVKRCASAVGEGSMAVQFVHERLAELANPA